MHGANPVDHFVHRYTHRVARGVLIAIGRPDGRLYSQTTAESWILREWWLLVSSLSGSVNGGWLLAACHTQGDTCPQPAGCCRLSAARVGS